MESDGSVHLAVIRQGQCGHTQVTGTATQVGQACQAIEEGVLAVDVQMNKGTHQDLLNAVVDWNVAGIAMRTARQSSGSALPRPGVADSAKGIVTHHARP